MWSIASHAGAGVAIAGLSATYYALARKNYQLEREIGMMGGRSDADRGNIKTSRDDMLSISESQSLLLKKELSHLSRESGHAMGLNVVDHQNEQIEIVQSQYSRMNLRQIVNRGQTNFPKNALSMEDLSRNCPEEEERYEPLLEESEPILTGPTSNSSNETEDESRSSLDSEELSQLDEPNDDHKDDEDNKIAVMGSLHQTRPAAPKICRCPVSKDSLIGTRRTKSPIVYYKNPGFGKRFACKIQESTEFPGIPLPGGDLTKDIREDDHNMTPEQNYKDSTQFLFPPVLSESKLSVYEDEDGETIDEDVVKDFDQPIDDMDITALVTQGLSHMDEIRDYNLQLQMLHDVRNTDYDGFYTETAIPEIPMKSEDESSSSYQSLLPQNSSTPTEEDYFNSEMKHMDEIPEPETLLDALSSTRTKSFTIREIPAGSWISLPARLYAESEQIPMNVIIFLSVVILLCGLMGRFFFSISDWIAAPINEDDEYNPAAMLEH